MRWRDAAAKREAERRVIAMLAAPLPLAPPKPVVEDRRGEAPPSLMAPRSGWRDSPEAVREKERGRLMRKTKRV